MVIWTMNISEWVCFLFVFVFLQCSFNKWSEWNFAFLWWRGMTGSAWPLNAEPALPDQALRFFVPAPVVIVWNPHWTCQWQHARKISVFYVPFLLNERCTLWKTQFLSLRSKWRTQLSHLSKNFFSDFSARRENRQ